MIKSADLENYQMKRKRAGYSDCYIDQEIGASKNVVNKAFFNDLVSGDTLKAFKSVQKLMKKGEQISRILEYEGSYPNLSQ